MATWGYGERRGSRSASVWTHFRWLTGDHLLGVIRLHVPVVLPDSLRLPLLSGLLSIKGVCIVLKNDDLEETGF